MLQNSIMWLRAEEISPYRDKHKSDSKNEVKRYAFNSFQILRSTNSYYVQLVKFCSSLP